MAKPQIASVPSEHDEDETTDDTSTRKSTKGQKKGPALVWTKDRDMVLTLVLRCGVDSIKGAVDAISDDETFTELIEGSDLKAMAKKSALTYMPSRVFGDTIPLVTQNKTRMRIGKLRKTLEAHGVKIPHFSRNFYNPKDAAEELAALFE